MNFKSDFACFILTHGRADNCVTYNALRKHGYTGKIYLIVDDEDDQIDLYKKNYGNQVIVFNKQAAIDMTDSGDNFGKRNSVVYARNYSFVIAEQINLPYFLMLDDDYKSFRYTFDNAGKYITKNIHLNNLDVAMEAMLEFFIKSNALTVAMSQGGDFIGGEGSKVSKLHRQGKFSRKAMNAFFMAKDRPFKFMGRINEDVNAYTEIGLRGGLFITAPRVRLEQTQTQANDGGLTDIYLDLGTYVKSFYSIMYAPSCVKIMSMGVKSRRLHHMVKWKHAAPMIISQDYKK